MHYIITGIQHGVTAVAAIVTVLIGIALFTPVVLAVYGAVGNLLSRKGGNGDDV